MKKDYSFGIIPFKRVGDEIELLIVKHKSQNHWAFPKGHPEEGENPVETALRELNEETGIQNCKVYDQYSLKESYKLTKSGIDYDKTVTYFLGEVIGDSKTNIIHVNEIEEAVWLNPDEARKTLTYNADFVDWAILRINKINELKSL